MTVIFEPEFLNLPSRKRDLGNGRSIPPKIGMTVLFLAANLALISQASSVSLRAEFKTKLFFINMLQTEVWTGVIKLQTTKIQLLKNYYNCSSNIMQHQKTFVKTHCKLCLSAPTSFYNSICNGSQFTIIPSLDFASCTFAYQWNRCASIPSWIWYRHTCQQQICCEKWC